MVSSVFWDLVCIITEKYFTPLLGYLLAFGLHVQTIIFNFVPESLAFSLLQIYQQNFKT